MPDLIDPYGGLVPDPSGGFSFSGVTNAIDPGSTPGGIAGNGSFGLGGVTGASGLGTNPSGVPSVGADWGSGGVTPASGAAPSPTDPNGVNLPGTEGALPIRISAGNSGAGGGAAEAGAGGSGGSGGGGEGDGLNDRGSSSGSPSNSVSASDILPNPLSGGFAQIAYHFKLFIDGDGVGSSSTGRPVVIAESGVTGFNIREVEIKSVGAPTAQTRITSATEFRIVVTEPMGTSFLDALYQATKQSGVRNMQKVGYKLQLSFRGYDESGRINANLLSDGFPNGGVWTWRVAFKNIECHVDAGSGTYTISAIIYDNEALDADALRTQEAYVIEAQTCNEFFDVLTKSMNQNIMTKYGEKLYEYKFTFHPRDGVDPGEFKIRQPNERELSSYRHLAFKDNKREKPTMNITTGAPVTELIEYLISATEDGQKYIKDSTGKLSGPSDLGNGDFRDSLAFRVYPEVKVSGYSWVTNRYTFQITFHIKGYKTQRTQLLAAETTEEKVKANSPKAIAAVQGYSGLRKRYDYIYTGLNTEVVDFDLRFNTAWNAQLPRFGGYIYYDVSAEPHAKVKDETRPANQIKALKEAQAKLAQQKAQLSSLNASLPGTLLGLAPSLTGSGGVGTQDATNALSGLTQQAGLIDGIRGTISGINQSEEAAFQGSLSPMSGSGTAYAETLPSASSAPTTISIIQGADGSRYAAGTGMTGQYHQSRSIYGALLDQIYANGSLMTISLVIKGDPYWLGLPLSELVTKGNPGNKVADFTAGDLHFILRLRYPMGVGENGSPTFREHEVFNGLYQATWITHTFANGEFKQTIQANRMPVPQNSDLAKITTNGNGLNGGGGGGSADSLNQALVAAGAVATEAPATGTPTATVDSSIKKSV